MSALLSLRWKASQSRVFVLVGFDSTCLTIVEAQKTAVSVAPAQSNPVNGIHP